MTNDNAAGMHAVAHALLRMLDSLEEPVVPRSFYARACDADVDTLEKAYVLAGQLPPVVSALGGRTEPPTGMLTRGEGSIRT